MKASDESNQKFRGRYFQGLYIVIKADPRPYRVQPTVEHHLLQCSGGNELLLKMPTWDYDLMYRRSAVLRAVNDGHAEQGLLDALDNFHEETKKVEKTGKYMYLRLIFPEDVELSPHVSQHCPT
jgi:hypothetical protein